MSRKFLQSFAVLVLTPLLLTGGVDRPAPSTLERTEAVLADFAGVLAGCGTTTCSTAGCLGSAHSALANGGPDKGPYHGCIVTQMACSYHGCAIDFGGMPMVDELSRLLPTLDRSSLLRLQQGHEDSLLLSVNPQRRAVQLMGCSGLVVLSIPLTEAQADELIQSTGGGG
jgi:hypothetical protein